jgi:hypothetical protein
MTDQHADALFRRLAAGEQLSESDRLHVSECRACGQAVAEAGRLDGRLRKAAQFLAGEPLPPGIQRDLKVLGRPPATGWVTAGAAVVVGVAVIAGLALASTRPTGDASPVPSTSSSGEAAPTVLPSPDASAEPGDFVSGPYGCGDGVEGFAIWVPSGWFANSAHDGVAACRYVSVEQFNLAAIDSPDSVPIRFNVLSGDFGLTDEILERRELTIADLPALRFELAGVDGKYLVYVIGIDGQLPSESNTSRFLTASTAAGDKTFDRYSAAVEEMLSRFAVTTPFRTPADVAATADDLMHDTATCTNDGGPFVLRYPDGWFTNEPAGETPGCTFFGPSDMSGDGGDGLPDGAEITISVSDGAVGSFDSFFSFDSVNVGGRPGQRTETDGTVSGDGRSYRYVVQLTNQIVGTNLLAAVRLRDATDYELAKAVLDRMLDTIRFEPPSGDDATCLASDLDIESGRVGAYHGHSTQLITLTNVSGEQCELAGAPKMTVQAPSGSKTVDLGRYARQALVIAPQSHATILVGAPAACSPRSDDVADTIQIMINQSSTQLRDLYIPLTCGDPVLLLFEIQP